MTKGVPARSMASQASRPTWCRIRRAHCEQGNEQGFISVEVERQRPGRFAAMVREKAGHVRDREFKTWFRNGLPTPERIDCSAQNGAGSNRAVEIA